MASTSTSDGQASLYRHPLAWLIPLAIAHVLSRVLISDGMKWDESEQILWSQQFLLGYGAQPPAYSWLQWLVNQVVGPSVLSLSVLKHALITLTYVLAWQTGRVLLPPKGAFWLAGGLVLMLPFGWDSVRDQTHTILVTAMCFGAWWMTLRQVRVPQMLNFVGLGLFCGVGMLAKYSFAMLIGVLLIAALTVPQVRRALLSRGWWLAPLVGLLIFAPHGWWLASHWHDATAETLNKMEISTHTSVFTGLGALAKAVLSTLGLWLIVVLASYRSRLWRAPPTVTAGLPAHTAEWRPWAWPLLSRYLLLVLLVLVGMVVLGHVSSFKQRWVLPLTAIAPLALYAWRPALLTHGAGRGYTGSVLGFALLFLAMATLRPWQAGWRGQPDELNHPVPQLAAQLSRAGYDGRGIIVGSDHMVAAMLHSRFPQSYAMACNPAFDRMRDCLTRAQAQAARTGVGLLVIARMDKAPPDWWSQVFASQPAPALQSLQIPYTHMPAGSPPMHYQYVWQAAASTTP